ncbi:MAG TPA: 2'-5' RNA ligase family protein [Gaiellaceae bacterium]
MPRTALIVPVPEAESKVGKLRLAHDSSAALGVPAHITILFPFFDADDVDEAELADLISRFPAFDFELDRVEHFPDGTTWLRPAPSLPFVDLTAAVWQRWPERPPYEGLHDEVIPHLTISETPIDVQLELPIVARAREVTLIEEDEPSGHWTARLHLPLLG